MINPSVTSQLDPTPFGTAVSLWPVRHGAVAVAGLAIGIVGDAGVRANAQQPRLFVGMILILIFAEAEQLEHINKKAPEEKKIQFK